MHRERPLSSWEISKLRVWLLSGCLDVTPARRQARQLPSPPYSSLSTAGVLRPLGVGLLSGRCCERLMGGWYWEPPGLPRSSHTH